MKNNSLYSSDYIEIVAKIRSARIEKGFTQKELANRLQRTQSYVSKIEAGQLNLNIIDLKKIVKALSKDVGDFL